ncbi:MAG: sigma-70 family RNA polymerase sigma factor [Bryobacterales bacterium]|nr:sigma-70 family RNA polymerase sigma factor [Bryobacterales bacterium]
MQQEVTRLLVEWREGNRAALDALLPVVYDELRRLAESYIARERQSHTLQPTALVHEAYVRLIGQDIPDFQNRAHFFGVAAHLMRQVLVDSARKFRAGKRGGGKNVSLDGMGIEIGDPSMHSPFLALEESLQNLEKLDARKAKILEMKYFGGLTLDEIVEACGVSKATVSRDLRSAEAWIRVQLTPGDR